MSDPDVPGEVPPPPPPPATPMQPFEPSLPETVPVPPADPTIQMPATTPMPPTQPGAGAPPRVPPVGPYGQRPHPDPAGRRPWYTRSGPLIVLLLALLAIGGVVAWLLLGGDDEDEPGSPGSSSLTIETRDATGAVLDRGFLINVVGPVGSEAAYEWLRPPDATPGQITGDGTGTDGRVDFEWQPDETVTDPSGWAATVTVIESVPAGWTPPGPLIECSLERADGADGVVSMTATVTSADPAADQEVTYTFGDFVFVPGDSVTCELTSVAPVETTTTTTTTTVPETTTTTVAETTTTVVPSTTIPIVTVPPQAEATLWDVIENSPDLSELRALVELAGLQDVLSDANATITLLAPSNQAITTAAGGVGAPDFTNPSLVEAVLLTHVDDTRALLLIELLALDPPEFVSVNPGPHPIDAASTPPTIGEAEVLVADVEAANGVLHVIDRVLLPEELPE